MIYKVYDNVVALRLDPGEEIISSMVEVCERENIKFGHFTGIGAVKDVEAGIFDPEEKIYLKKEYFGKYELASLTGNVTTHEGKPYIHAHGVCSDIEGECFGGHLSRAVVSVAGEIFITKINAEAGRKLNEDIMFNQMILDLPEKI